MTTMEDVARLAGVSGSTVSHVLNGTRAVNERTRVKVQEAIQSTGYRRNGLARSLAMQRTQTLGLAISVLSNPYFGSLVNTIEKVASAAGYTIVLADTHDDPEREAQTVNTLLDRQVDGLILAPAGSSGNRNDVLDMVRASGTPVVLIDRFQDFPCDQYAPENLEPVRQLASHLLELGHRRIAAITGTQGLSTTTERTAGFRAAMEETGIDTAQVLVEEGHSTAAGGEAAMDRLLGLELRPTAIVSLNNAMTIGVMKSLRHAGLKVPQDMALVGFDDFEWADSFEPRLTTMAQDIESMATGAVRALLKRIQGSDAPFARESIAPFMRHRNSCGCPD